MYNNIINSMERYAIYLRKSRKDLEAESHGSGETLAKHSIILTNLYQSMNIKREQVDTYKEIVSGDSISSRPVIQELLQLVEQGLYAGVLVTEVERLARGNTLDQGIVSNAFQYSNTKIITPLKIYDPSNEYDQEYFEFGLFMSRREYKTINRRLQRGREISATQGKFPGSRPPYGYKRKKLENDKGWTLEIVPEQAEVVKTVYNMYAYQHTIPADICRYLDNSGVKPLKSDSWSINSIRDMLSNPVYIGKIKWKDRKIVKVIKDGKLKNTQPKNKGNDVILVDGLHPAIIDEKTFNITQQRKEEIAPPIPGIYNIQNPLAGIVRCAKCKRLMFRNRSNILCCTNTKCDNVSSKIELIEKKVIESLKVWLEQYEKEIATTSITTSNSSEIINMKKKQLSKIETDFKSCDSKLEKIYDFLESGVYDINTFTDRKNKILIEQKDLYNKLQNITSEINDLEKLEKSKIELIPKVKMVLNTYNDCTDIKEKNDLLKSVIEKIEYLKKERCYSKYSNPENFELLIYPKF